MTIPIDAALLRTLTLDPLPPDSDKTDRGAVLAVAGGRGVPGAPVLVGLASLRAGAGKLKLATTTASAVALGVAVPEAAILTVTADGGGEISSRAAARLAETAAASNALVIGPGMMNSRAARILAARLLAAAEDTPFVVDAAALPETDGADVFARAAAGRAVLTPHAGEMAGMLGMEKDKVLLDPLAAAREAAGRFQAVIVMKGPTTWVVSPAGLAWRHDGGVPGLGTSGSGDVLAGLIAGFLAQGHPPADAAIRGVFVHAAAGTELSSTVGPLGFLARELLDVIPRVRATIDG
jgi:hydroxyethylthiazole kinase-like uncharacterized protein yjeF